MRRSMRRRVGHLQSYRKSTDRLGIPMENEETLSQANEYSQGPWSSAPRVQNPEHAKDGLERESRDIEGHRDWGKRPPTFVGVSLCARNKYASAVSVTQILDIDEICWQPVGDRCFDSFWV